MGDETIDVPTAYVGRLIGANGSTIQRLIKSTGCGIEVPRGLPKTGEGTVAVALTGGVEQRRAAARAIQSIVSGGENMESEDALASAEGAMVFPHKLETYDRQSWARWRMVPAERECGMRVEMGKHSLRLWAQKGRVLLGGSAERARVAAENAIREASELFEMTVDTRLEYEPENWAQYDGAFAQLVDKYGVLMFVPRPENGCVPIRITGPEAAARVGAELIEARFVRGRCTAGILLMPGHIEGMGDQMSADFERDLQDLEAEYQVKTHRSQALLWIEGQADEAVRSARQTLVEMLQFYFPKDYILRAGFKPDCVKEFRKDEDLRVLMAKDDCAIAFDVRGGAVWICGRCRDPVQKRIDVLVHKWNAENWELELPDYGAAMWLLGPGGSGDFLKRMQIESGTKIIVNPTQLQVRAHGEPKRVKEAERLVKEALARLEEKKRKEEEDPIKVKPLLTAAPPHMEKILLQLKELDEKKVRERKKERIIENAREAAAERERLQQLEDGPLMLPGVAQQQRPPTPQPGSVPPATQNDSRQTGRSSRSRSREQPRTNSAMSQ